MLHYIADLEILIKPKTENLKNIVLAARRSTWANRR